MKELIERLEKSSGPDRELDCEIHVAVFRWTLTKVGGDIDGKNDCEIYAACGKLIKGFGYPTRGIISPYFHVPHDANYTSSVDAAIALAGRLFPSATVSLYLNTPHGSAKARLTDDSVGTDDSEIVTDWRPIPALALALAVVRAVIAKQEKG